MEKIRAEIKVISSGFDSVDTITDFLVETSGLPREKILEIQAENDAEWKERYGMTAREMLEAKRNEKKDGKRIFFADGIHNGHGNAVHGRRRIQN